MTITITRKRLLMSLVVIIAVWNLGQGSYILAKATLAKWLIASAWQQSTSAERSQIKPWPWADTWPVARLTMAEHNVDSYVLAGASGASLAFGPGYLFSSAMPTTKGNTIIAAHRDTHFSFLEQVQIGETISISNADGHVRDYIIEDLHIVDKSDVSWIDADNSPYQLTLVTCYPFNTLLTGGRLRYVVRAVYQGEVSA